MKQRSKTHKFDPWEEKRQALLADETGTLFKDATDKIRVALVFPNTYELGMSNLGFQTVYRLFNEHPDVVCERAFLPDADDLEEVGRSPLGLRSIETAGPLRDFDVIAFSISYELDYPNLLKILELAGLPYHSEDRDEDHPLIMAGGPAMYINPEPVAPFLDLIGVGDGEELVPEFVATLHWNVFGGKQVPDRNALLKALMAIEGVYVPRFYRPIYDENGLVSTIIALKPDAPLPVKRRITRDLGLYNISSVIRTPNTEFKDTHLVEVARGCARSCRFCFAGYGFRPVRYRKTDQVAELLAQGAMANACDASTDDPTKNPNGPKTHGEYRGHGTSRDNPSVYGAARDTMDEQVEDAPGVKIGLIGSSLSDNPWTTEIATGLAEKGYRLNASALRAETTGEELTQVLSTSGQKMLTLAPEAGTERLRKVIKKPMKEEHIMTAIGNAVAAGIKQIKLYYMCGLPTETDDDLHGMAALCQRILALYPLDKLVVSLNPFVPKPFTPFQWHPQETAKGFERKRKILEEALRRCRPVQIRMESPRLSEMQALLSRGDRRTSELLLALHRNGGDWGQALRDLEVDVEYQLRRERAKDEFLPWEILDLGLDKDYLWAEYQAGLAGEVNPKPFMRALEAEQRRIANKESAADEEDETLREGWAVSEMTDYKMSFLT